MFVSQGRGEHVVYSTQVRMLKLDLKKMYLNSINKTQQSETTNK